MLDKKIISIVLGTMCLMLTMGICVQIKTVKASNSTVGSNYQENNLKDQILKYKEKYENKLRDLEKAEKDLEKAREVSTKNNKELQEKEDAIKKGNKIIGLTEVTGPGVTITLSDSKIDRNKALNLSDMLVHDLDVLKVINELRNAGAEAIAINGQRIVNTTGITCRGSVIDINGEKVGAPFVITAIGLPEQLANVDRLGGYLDWLRGYGIGAELTRSNKITIPKYSGVFTFDYAETADK